MDSLDTWVKPRLIEDYAADRKMNFLVSQLNWEQMAVTSSIAITDVLLLRACKSKLTIAAPFNFIPNSSSKIRRERRRIYDKINLGYGFNDNSEKERGERASDGSTTGFSRHCLTLPAGLLTVYPPGLSQRNADVKRHSVHPNHLRHVI